MLASLISLIGLLGIILAAHNHMLESMHRDVSPPAKPPTQ